MIQKMNTVTPSFEIPFEPPRPPSPPKKKERNAEQGERKTRSKF
jgi:hypothetical protein